MNTNTFQIYQLIGQIISFNNNAAALKFRLESFNKWEQLVYHSSKHLLLPTIYKRLQEKALLGLLPADLIQYLEEIHGINHNRNLQILKQIKTIHQILADAHITHVFVKGAAILIKGLKNQSLERMVGDIDVLVERSSLHTAFKLLQDNGYTESIGFDYEVKNYRHLDRQISKTGIAAVELHDELIRHPNQHLVNVGDLLAKLVMCNQFPIPNDYYMGLHCVMAFQVNDLGYYYKHISLKTLSDSLVLQIPQQPELLNNLQYHKQGRLFIAWAQFLSGDYHSVKLEFRQAFQLSLMLIKLKHSYLGKVDYRLKWSVEFIKQRLKLWFTNRSYRRHILKDKLNTLQN
ncbi:nucleotidyltransferase family protein [Paucihalobacter sp.]|uniref:nucleotidyltransferase family protein n=1 Tax=Paucihalobacter sp. TaxID=2850405 RepID=UPI003D160D62